MYTKLTMHNVCKTVTTNSKKNEKALLHIREGRSYSEYCKEINKGCSPYIDNPMLLTEDQYYQLGYVGKGELE